MPSTTEGSIVHASITASVHFRPRTLARSASCDIPCMKKPRESRPRWLDAVIHLNAIATISILSTSHITEAFTTKACRSRTNSLSVNPWDATTVPFGDSSSVRTPFMARGNDEDGRVNDQDVGAPSKEEEDGTFVPNRFFIESPRLLLCDTITIFLTCQLLGLADVFSDPEFWAAGGLLQPIGFPTTMSTLVTRDASISLAWIGSGLKNGAYQVASIEDVNAVVKYVLNTFTDYCILQVLGALGLAFLVHQPVDGMELLRQCWFTLIMLGTFRYFYAKNTVIY